MNLDQIDRLAATVPATIDARQRARLHGYAETASRCEARIQRLRQQLDHTLQATDASPGTASPTVSAEPNAALTLACELDTLERLQPRVDAWLTDYVAVLVTAGAPEAYGDGAPI
jgi:hypothetical protein